MTAAYITELGSAEAIRVGPLPVPQPGPTDVLVRVEAVAVNPVDTFVRSGAYRTPTPFPFVLGRDLVGTVAAVGPGAVPYRLGQRVWCNSLGHGGRQGACAGYAVVPAERLYPLPPEADPVAAVAVFHPAATAYLGLFVHARLRPGETVFVGGGAGHVGTAVVTLAAEAGARVVASARPEDFGRCRAAGAVAVFDYRDPALAERLRGAAPEGVDVHWDTSGRHDLGRAVGLLARGGRIVLMAGLGTQPALPVGPLYTRDASLVGFAISNAATSDLVAAAGRINTLVAGSKLSPRAAESMPLSRTAEAHLRLEQGALRGARLVLQPPQE